VPLTALETDLLHVFASRPNKVLSRDDILDLAGDPEAEPFSRSIDKRVARLRKKVVRDPGAPQAIRTVHGQGYVFVPVVHRWAAGRGRSGVSQHLRHPDATSRCSISPCDLASG
jgi:DNA-binding winged helix-turn-helix (wHTH) protein